MKKAPVGGPRAGRAPLSGGAVDCDPTGPTLAADAVGYGLVGIAEDTGGELALDGTGGRRFGCVDDHANTVQSEVARVKR